MRFRRFNAGIPLFLEKPVAVNMAQALALEEAASRSGCPTIVSFPLRTSPLFELAADFLRKGVVGRPEHIMATNYVPYGTVYFDAPYRNFEITQGYSSRRRRTTSTTSVS